MKLKEGDIIELREGHEVYTDLPENTVYSNRKGSRVLTHAYAKIKGSLAFLAGRYIVTHASFDGGGCGHGAYDVFPSGYHVFCVADKDPSRRVDFYQSGCFTAMIPSIEPIGRATATWAPVDKS